MDRANPSRRDFLARAAAGALAFGASPILARRAAASAASAAAPAPFLVVVNLIGGNDGLNTIVPTHLGRYYALRPNLALPATSLPLLSGGFRLHPALTKLKGVWDAGELHVVHKVGYPQGNGSHFTSSDIYSYGARDLETNRRDGRGWLGRFTDAHCASPANPLGAVVVGLGRTPDVNAKAVPPLLLRDPDTLDLLPDPQFAADHALRVAAVQRMLGRGAGEDEVRRVLTTAHSLAADFRPRLAGWRSPAAYPSTHLGQGLRVVSQLLHGSFGTRIFVTGFSGFDTHAGQLVQHAALLEQLDGALGSFRTDLVSKGLWSKCVVVVISEFGRRNGENGSGGTDHGYGNAFLVMGGAVRGARMTGTLTDADLGDESAPFAYDFREIYAHVLERHLGLDAAPVFPEPFQRSGEITLV